MAWDISPFMPQRNMLTYGSAWYTEKVVQSEVLQLLSAYRLNTLLLMESIPQLGDNEKIISFDEAVFDCSGNTLASFYFISIILKAVSICLKFERVVMYHKPNRKVDSRLWWRCRHGLRLFRLEFSIGRGILTAFSCHYLTREHDLEWTWFLLWEVWYFESLRYTCTVSSYFILHCDLLSVKYRDSKWCSFWGRFSTLSRSQMLDDRGDPANIRTSYVVILTGKVAHETCLHWLEIGKTGTEKISWSRYTADYSVEEMSLSGVIVMGSFQPTKNRSLAETWRTSSTNSRAPRLTRCSSTHR